MIKTPSRKLRKFISSDKYKDYYALYSLSREISRITFRRSNFIQFYSIKFIKLHLKCWRQVVKCRVKYSDYKIDYLPLFLNIYPLLFTILAMYGFDYICYNFIVIDYVFLAPEFSLMATVVHSLMGFLFIPLSNFFFERYIERLNNIRNYFYNSKDKDIQMILKWHRFEWSNIFQTPIEFSTPWSDINKPLTNNTIKIRFHSFLFA